MQMYHSHVNCKIRFHYEAIKTINTCIYMYFDKNKLWRLEQSFLTLVNK